MIPYPIEEMRKFILKEYPNLNNMLHPDYKAGALMSAILRWWTDEQQPEIENLRKQIAALQEIAVEEGAYRAYYEANARTESYADFGYSLVANGLFSDARDRLTKEHPEIDWE